MRRAAVLGTGLIGTSVAIGLRASGWHVTGWDPSADNLAVAADMHALDRVAGSQEEAVVDVDLVVLAGPTPAVLAALRHLDTAALVTDVTGVKTPVVDAAVGRRFVGGHPMAGRETSGPTGASGSLFRGATWALTTDGATEDDLDLMEAIVDGLGARPVRMTAAAHDRAVAVASHLPHVVAAGLVAAVASDEDSRTLAAGGFRDLTRIAMSDPGWWVDVLVANGPQVAPTLRSMAVRLTGWADSIEEGDGDAIAAALGAAREVRSDMAPPVAQVGVLLEDRPGEIALVGAALSASGVDLRDLQLRHGTHGGGGVLTLSVREDEAEKLRASLRAQGFSLR